MKSIPCILPCCFRASQGASAKYALTCSTASIHCPSSKHSNAPGYLHDIVPGPFGRCSFDGLLITLPALKHKDLGLPYKFAFGIVFPFSSGELYLEPQPGSWSLIWSKTLIYWTMNNLGSVRDHRSLDKDLFLSGSCKCFCTILQAHNSTLNCSKILKIHIDTHSTDMKTITTYLVMLLLAASSVSLTLKTALLLDSNNLYSIRISLLGSLLPKVPGATIIPNISEYTPFWVGLAFSLNTFFSFHGPKHV